MSDDREIRRGILALERQADEAYRLAQYEAAESLYSEAARLADAHADWPLRIRLHFWLAWSRQMQPRYEAAMTTYAWLISLAHDPEAAPAIAGDEGSLRLLAQSYPNLASCGRFLTSLSLDRLHGVLDDGEAFLREIDHPEWVHEIRYIRGSLLRDAGRYAEARQEIEASVALKRRTSDTVGYTLNGRLCSLGDTLRRLGDHRAAAVAYREVWDGDRSGPYERVWAAQGLAYAEWGVGNLVGAEHRANAAVAGASQMESATIRSTSYEVLVDVLLAAGKVAGLSSAAAGKWRWGRRGSGYDHFYVPYQLARVRMALARSALGLSANLNDPLPWFLFLVPAGARARARRHLAQAQRWLARAEGPARRLDRQRGQSTHADWVRHEAERLGALRKLVGEAA